jgi:hypothetical protein
MNDTGIKTAAAVIGMIIKSGSVASGKFYGSCNTGLTCLQEIEL